MPERSRIFLDYDDKALFEVVSDIYDLQERFSLGKADIYESSPTYLYAPPWHGLVRYGSYHVKFLKDVRPWEDVMEILDFSNAHKGFKYFSKIMKDVTLRVSGQKGSKIPEKICTIDKKGVIVDE